MLRTPVGFVRGTAIALLIGCAPLASTATAAAPAASAGINVETLKPGQFVWKPAAAAEGPVEVVVSLGQQMAYVYRGGALIGASTVSSGKPGHDTPVGRFEILQKRKEHYSNKYNNAPMPFMQRLTWTGVALHGGAIPGHPASHGCIRLPMKFARHLFDATKLGASVYIMDDVPSSPETALALARTVPDYRPATELASG